MPKRTSLGRYTSPDGRTCNLYQDAGGIFYLFRYRKRRISDFVKWKEALPEWLSRQQREQAKAAK